MSSNLLLKSVGLASGFALSVSGYYWLVADRMLESHNGLMKRMDALDQRLCTAIATSDVSQPLSLRQDGGGAAV